MASLLSADNNDFEEQIHRRDKTYSISSDDDSSHLADDDEKFYDAIDDTVQLLNSGLSISSNINSNSTTDNNLNNNSILSSSPSSISSSNINYNHNDCGETNDVKSSSSSNVKQIENEVVSCDDAELETPWTLWFDR